MSIPQIIMKNDMYNSHLLYRTFFNFMKSLDLFFHIIGDHNVEVIQEKVRD